MQLAKRIGFLVISILLLSQMSIFAAYVVVDEPELQDAVVLVGDLYGKGNSNLLLGQDGSIFVLEEDAKRVILEDITGQISALALGDLNGDLHIDLVVGTDSAGALYFYSLKDGIWERQGQPQYIWDAVRSLAVHDFNRDGWGDLLILTDKGEAQILLSAEGKLHSFWKSPADQVVVGLEVIDVDQNGHPDVVYAFQGGYVGVLTWTPREFVTLWENYPWGLVESLVVLPHSNSPEWLVVTSQKMLYSWRWKDGGVVSSRAFQANELGEHLFYFPDEGLLSFSQKTGVSLFELKSGSVIEKWRVPGVFGNLAFRHQSDFYFRNVLNGYHRLMPGDVAWRVFIHDREITDMVSIFEQSGQIYFSLQDLAEPLGFGVFSGDTWSFLKNDTVMRLWPGKNNIEYGDLIIPIRAPILEMDGCPYVPATIFPSFGWRVEYDVSRQHVVFLKIWGWWL